jgi:hypothetical protein
MEKALPKWLNVIDESFLSEDFREQYKSIIQERPYRLR